LGVSHLGSSGEIRRGSTPLSRTTFFEGRDSLEDNELCVRATSDFVDGEDVLRDMKKSRLEKGEHFIIR
jgi:hypothetical protein